MSISTQYLKELHHEFGYYANWLPGAPMALGDIGIIKDHQFHYRTSLDQLGINVPRREWPGTKNLEYTSKQGVNLTLKLAGEVSVPGTSLSKGDAGVSISFNKGEAMLFQLHQVRTEQLDNIPELERAIKRSEAADQWRKEYVVVSELKVAGSGTILLSNSANSVIDLKANADLRLGTMDLANTNVGLSISRQSDMALKIVAKTGLAPLFKGLMLKQPLFGGEGELKERGIESQGSTNSARGLIEIQP